jgi:predicted phosphodiesterase
MSGKNNRLAVLIPDIHYPYADLAAVEVAKKIVQDNRPGRVIVLGDTVDAELFSRHAPSLPMSDSDRASSFLRDEIGPAKELFDFFFKYTNEVIYILGNHEYRVESWAASQGRVGESIVDLISPAKLLGAGRGKEFKVIPYAVIPNVENYYVVCKNAVAVHGWGFGKHCAADVMAKARTRSVFFGHTHRYQVYCSRDGFTGEVHQAVSCGTLAHLKPIYQVGGSPNDWCHAVGLVYHPLDKNKRGFSPYVVTIDKGKAVMPDGKLISV